MQLFFISLLFLASCLPSNNTELMEQKSITKNDMTVKWEIQGEHLQITMQAPTKGWVAIGFNKQHSLKGTHLAMGAIQDEEIKLEDRYTIAAGNYPLITDLGGQNALTLIDGTENEEGTTISFQLPLQAVDSYHFSLEEGKMYNLLLAYSQSDDFMHHSIMRTSMMITL